MQLWTVLKLVPDAAHRNSLEKHSLMNLKKIVLSLVIAAIMIPSMAFAGTKKIAGKVAHRKGGYVHATTFTTKTGKVVHRKGGYRHAVKLVKIVKKTK
jgi:hypothetical protein